MGCIRIYMFMGCIPTWYFWQGNHQIYGHIRRIYTLLAAPRCIVRFCCCAGTLGTTSQHLFSPLSCMSRMSGRGHSSWYVRARMPPALLLHFFLSWMNHWMSGQGHLSWYVRAWLPPALLLHYFLSWTIGWVGRAISHGTCMNASCITSAFLSFLNEPLDEWAGPFIMVRTYMNASCITSA